MAVVLKSSDFQLIFFSQAVHFTVADVAVESVVLTGPVSHICVKKNRILLTTEYGYGDFHF